MLAATMFRGGRDSDAQQWLARIAGDATGLWEPRRDAAEAPSARPLENVAARRADAWRRDRHPGCAGARAIATTACRAWNDLPDLSGWPTECRRRVRVRLARPATPYTLLATRPAPATERGHPRPSYACRPGQPARQAGGSRAHAHQLARQAWRRGRSAATHHRRATALRRRAAESTKRCARPATRPTAAASRDAPRASSAHRWRWRHPTCRCASCSTARKADRVDAVARCGHDRRAGRERADLRATRMGPWRASRSMPALVARQRSLNKGRTRPWTDAELGVGTPTA